MLKAAGGAFLTGLAPRAAAALANADAVYASAYFDGYTDYGIALFTEAGEIVHRYVLPGRGHDSVFDPTGRRLVTFARRPGTFAAVIDTAREDEPSVFHAPADRHFYGHGRFSADGRLLYATENDFDNARGVIGIYDATDGFRRIGEFDSGGIGPHDIVVLPGGRAMLVANGGLETHPDYGRTVLNVATMSPNLALVDLESTDIVAIHQLPPQMHKLSIRHLGMTAEGTVWFGAQNQGDVHELLPLAGSVSPDGSLRLLDLPGEYLRLMRGYIGSVAVNEKAGSVVFTSPQGNVALEVDRRTEEVCACHEIRDVCGAAPRGDGFLLSSGLGMLDGRKTSLAWDNHIVRRPA
ncbi:DUF1513 domain-containing protein [Oricola thermophila]|uniref:DUF1513 domain-containing protein n=1 Tax=Oricola thermophila TaxID=2742145 RepID=A0A6N1VE98_9HYPH|nr:DUF1513 domain-containing protein [Oricola thermophila]QKV19184.1 DUF1513 domain-containing protein [Oricola thermophila]